MRTALQSNLSSACNNFIIAHLYLQEEKKGEEKSNKPDEIPEPGKERPWPNTPGQPKKPGVPRPGTPEINPGQPKTPSQPGKPETEPGPGSKKNPLKKHEPGKDPQAPDPNLSDPTTDPEEPVIY